MDAQHKRKQAMNAAYAERFPRRSSKERKALRRKRVQAREAAWLKAMGVVAE